MNHVEFNFESGDDADRQRDAQRNARLESDLSGVTRAIRQGINKYMASDEDDIRIPVSKQDIEAFTEHETVIKYSLDGWDVSPTSGFEYDRDVPIKVEMLRIRRDRQN